MPDQTARLNVLVALKSVITEGNAPLEWLKRFTIGLTAAAGAMAAFSAKRSLDFGGQIVDLSNAAGMGAQALQTFTARGSEMRLTMEDIAKSSEKLRKNLQEARENGTNPLNADLATLRMTAVGLQALAPERQWEQIARAIESAADKQAALNAASNLFGEKQFAKMKEFLGVLASEGYDRLFSATKNLRVDDKDLQTLDDAGDKLSRIALQLKVIAAKGTAGVLGEVLAVVGSMGFDNQGATTEQRLAEAKKRHALWAQAGNKVMADRYAGEVAEYEATLRGRPVDPLKEKTEQRRILAESASEREKMTAAENAAAAATQKKADETARLAQIQAVADAKGEALLNEQERERETREVGRQLIEANRTALESYNAEVTHLNALMRDATPEELAAIERARESAALRIAAATTIPAAENALNARLQQLGAERAQLDADHTRTDAEKWADRRRLIEEEITARQRLAEVMRQQRDNAPKGSTEYLVADQSYQGALGGVTSAQGQLAGMGPNPYSLTDQLTSGLTNLRASFGTTAQQIAGTITGTIGSAIDSVSAGISGLILGTTNWRDALASVGNSILTTVVQSVVQMGVRWVATQIMMATMGKAILAGSVAATTPLAMAQASIWATPATLATIASFGGAAASAPGMIAAANAMTQALALMPGYEEGGYTGGKRGQIAGFTHGEEVVFSAPAVDALGRDNLLALHAGALSPSKPSAAPGGATGMGGKPVRVVHYIARSRSDAEMAMRDPNFDNRALQWSRETLGIG